MAPCVTALVETGRGRILVELDGAAWRTFPVDAVVRARLAVGTELDRPRARELGRALRRVEALDIGTRALARRDRSTASVSALLARRGVAPVDRVEALAALEEARYLDDHRFARSRAAALAARGYGDAAIRFDLEGQGLPPESIAMALESLLAEGERARAFVARTEPSVKTVRRLAARGFSAESIEAVLGDAAPPVADDDF